MILLDTNVVSELMRPAPSEAVLAWFAAQEAHDLYLSAIGEAELHRGAAMLPERTRRDQLMAAIDAMIIEDFAGRILPFDSNAATARAQGAAIATRNTADFAGCGIAVIDPWVHQQGTREPS
jgi:predicted nucleic acid-binding protein